MDTQRPAPRGVRGRARPRAVGRASYAPAGHGHAGAAGGGAARGPLHGPHRRARHPAALADRVSRGADGPRPGASAGSGVVASSALQWAGRPAGAAAAARAARPGADNPGVAGTSSAPLPGDGRQGSSECYSPPGEMMKLYHYPSVCCFEFRGSFRYARAILTEAIVSLNY